MVDWNPRLIAQGFTQDTALQQQIIEQLFEHPRWHNFDQGNISEQQLMQQASSVLNMNLLQVEQLMTQAKQSLQAKPDSVQLLKQAKQQGLACYCLSNLSHEWFEFLMGWHDFFDCFDGKVISAQEGITKPDLQIYQRMIQRYQLAPEHTLFIDDRAENTQTAQSLGLKTVTFNDSLQDKNAISQFIME